MKVLITGAKGQLGQQMVCTIKEGKSEIGKIDERYTNIELLGLSSEELDITNIEEIREVFYNFKPDIVINCAAYTNVDDCEENKDLAFKVNSLGPRNLAIACEEINAKILHISTDYVFEGNGNEPYKEYDMTAPVSVYGKSKLLGENYIQSFCSRYFIIRSAWLYGYNGKNFVKTILSAAKKKGYLEVVNDQRGNPTNAEDLVYHILKLALTDEYGVYHCTGIGECSWYEFACKIVEYSGIQCEVKAITSNKLTRAAKRPSYSSLDNMMLRCTISDEMRQWEDALKTFVKNIER